MDGVPPNPFQGGIVDNELVISPPIILGIPSIGPIDHGPSGTLSNTHATASPVPTSGGPLNP